jgi:gas vesicle protein
MDNRNNKITTYVLGGIIGAALGVVAALLLDRSSELEGKEISFSGKKASRTVMGIIQVLWSLIEKGH